MSSIHHTYKKEGKHGGIEREENRGDRKGGKLKQGDRKGRKHGGVEREENKGIEREEKREG